MTCTGQVGVPALPITAQQRSDTAEIVAGGGDLAVLAEVTAQGACDADAQPLPAEHPGLIEVDAGALGVDAAPLQVTAPKRTPGVRRR